MSLAQLEAVARLFAVLSEPSRLVLLQLLHAGPRTVTELMAAARMKQANASKHLSVLHAHRLVRRTRNGTCVKYEIADPTVVSLCNLVCSKMQRDAKRAAALFSPKI
ncbi:MAG TPA: metalloregulator ArsR/SmtB family transcription factor [Verrucomicrobiae bacterium]|nr:metalloregulator ArsR/SmtB family transcription factor [Verrucomicrobiae bacterium]